MLFMLGSYVARCQWFLRCPMPVGQLALPQAVATHHCTHHHCHCKDSLTGALALLNNAGVPTNNDVTYCPVNSTSCYFYSNTWRNFAAAQTYCASLSGNLVSWNSDPEQLDVSG
jgi:hypothetical protein